ncbi:MAG: ribonuclease HII [Dethiobacter sp.]|jgi:ribonuclease HII|nr:ribonuclease HII [Dethiobacter sp.]MBS3902429.1 ribonuclease HII [Dethiobacter sp.]
MKLRNFAKMTVEEICCSLSEAAPSGDELMRLSADRRTGARRLAERHMARSVRQRRESERLSAMLSYERAARENGFVTIAGVDEAGRGPLAGPVVAAAVILSENFYLPGLNDSKKVRPAKREELYLSITKAARAWSVAVGEVAEIDNYNILVASKLAMGRALASLAVIPDFVLLDALELEGLPVPQLGIIRGDSLSLSVAAASIIAKVTRDRWMCETDKLFPGYGFAVHKGYPTALHRRAIAKLGPCSLHRKSFLLLPEEK